MENLSKHFLDKINLIYTNDELKIIEEGFKHQNPTIFRVNTLKKDFDALKNLKDYGFEFEKINYLTNAYKITKDGNLKLSDLKSFKKGYIYVQGITSQIPIELINLPENLDDFKVLDLTAAPGGKTTQISAKMNNLGKIMSNEKNSIRLEKLKYTVNKQEASNVEIIKFDANNLKKQFIENNFDVIIADLPCSAEGRINLDKEKSYKYLEKLGINKRNVKIQQEILSNSIKLLKSGGQLIYSTCTLDPLENEGIVNYLLFQFPELEVSDISKFFNQEGLKDISKKGILNYKKQIYKKDIEKTYRILPATNTEGFFVAKFTKK